MSGNIIQPTGSLTPPGVADNFRKYSQLEGIQGINPYVRRYVGAMERGVVGYPLVKYLDGSGNDVVAMDRIMQAQNISFFESALQTQLYKLVKVNDPFSNFFYGPDKGLKVQFILGVNEINKGKLELFEVANLLYAIADISRKFPRMDLYGGTDLIICKENITSIMEARKPKTQVVVAKAVAPVKVEPLVPAMPVTPDKGNGTEVKPLKLDHEIDEPPPIDKKAHQRDAQRMLVNAAAAKVASEKAARLSAGSISEEEQTPPDSAGEEPDPLEADIVAIEQTEAGLTRPKIYEPAPSEQASVALPIMNDEVRSRLTADSRLSQLAPEKVHQIIALLLGKFGLDDATIELEGYLRNLGFSNKTELLRLLVSVVPEELRAAGALVSNRKVHGVEEPYIVKPREVVYLKMWAAKINPVEIGHSLGLDNANQLRIRTKISRDMGFIEDSQLRNWFLNETNVNTKEP